MTEKVLHHLKTIRWPIYGGLIVLGITPYIYPNLTNAVAVTAGGEAGLALTDDGRVVPLPVLNSNSTIVTQLPSGITNAVMVSAGDSHGVVLHANGGGTSWNGGTFETIGPSLTNFISIDSGWGNNLGLLADLMSPCGDFGS